MQPALISELSNFRLKTNVLGEELCTFALGGNIPLLVEPQSLDELIKVLEILKSHKHKWRIIGAGSNLLINDNGIEEVVIRLGRHFSKNTVLPETNVQRFYASESLMRVSRKTTEAGLSGLEFAAGIPATIGGAVVMNAGAHGSSISDVLKTVHLVNENLELVSYSHQEMNFAYRSSRITNSEVVIAADFELIEKDPAEIVAKRNSSLTYRKKTQPLHLRSAGSVFKNPPGDKAAAELIEELGLKGKKHGGAQISALHSNWIVVVNELAKASDVSYLIDSTKEIVLKEFGIELDVEIIRW